MLPKTFIFGTTQTQHRRLDGEVEVIEHGSPEAKVDYWFSLGLISEAELLDAYAQILEGK